MNRRQFLSTAGLAATAAVPLAGCTAGHGTRVVFSESFESPLEGWERRAAIGPEVDLEEFRREVERTDERAHDGEFSLRVFAGGDHDDGTAWVARPVELPDADRFTVGVWAWSESESFNVLRNLVAALAPEPPEAEEDFPEPGRNSTGIPGAPYGGLREPLHRAEGWERYVFEWEPEAVPDVAHLAVGVSVVWESDATHFLDSIRLTAQQD